MKKAREPMRALNLGQKVQMLTQEASLLRAKKAAGGIQQSNNDPKYWVSILGSDNLKTSHLRLLRVNFRDSGKRWLRQFVENDGGLRALINRLPKGASDFVSVQGDSLALELFNCLGEFLKNEYGMQMMLVATDTIHSIANVLTVKAEDKELVQVIHTRVYEALDAICWQSDEGVTAVLKALQTKYDGLQFVVDELQSTDAIELKKAAMQLIFHLVNVNDDLKERITIRQEFLDRGMIRCLQRLRDWCEEKSAIATEMIKAKSAKGTYVSIADLQLLNNQCSVFEEEMSRDRREAASNALNAGDLDAAFECLKESANASNCTRFLSRTLSRLVDLPTDKPLTTVRLWQNIEHVVDATVKDAEGASYTLLDVETAFRRFHEKPTVVYVSSPQSATSSSASPSASPDAPGAPPAPGEGGGAPEAPGAPGAPDAPSFGDAPDAPAFGAPDAPAFGDVPDAPAFGAPDAPAFGDIPDAPGAPGAPPGPPGAPGGFTRAAVPVEPPPVMPYTKKTVKPGAKMKIFHWAVIKDKEIANTVWNEMSDQKVQFDTRLFTQAFSSVTKSAKGGGEEDGESAEEVKVVEKKKAISLLEPARQNNVTIALGKFKQNFEQLRDMMWKGDGFTQEQLEILLSCVPSMDEVSLVQGYAGNVAELGRAEQFMKCVAVIPAIGQRVESMLFVSRFDDSYADLAASVAAVDTGLKALEQSKNFRLVLETCLALGNYLNAEQKGKGGAYGFSLDSINKFKLLKSNKDPETGSTMTLLDFLILTLRNSPAANFVVEFAPLASAARVELGSVTAEVGKMKGSVRKAEGLVKTIKAAGRVHDRLDSVLEKSLEVQGPKADSLEARLKGVGDRATKLIQSYGEDPKKLALEELLGIVLEFTTEYQAGLDRMVKKEQDAIKAQEKSAFEAKRKAELAAKLGAGAVEESEAKGGEGKEKDPMSLKQANVADIRASLAMRRAKAKQAKDDTNSNKLAAVPPPLPSASSSSPSSSPALGPARLPSQGPPTASPARERARVPPPPKS